jgi:hypothetical protein
MHATDVARANRNIALGFGVCLVLLGAAFLVPLLRARFLTGEGLAGAAEIALLFLGFTAAAALVATGLAVYTALRFREVGIARRILGLAPLVLSGGLLAAFFIMLRYAGR